MTGSLKQEIKAPNGVTYEQPLGLFINGEFVKSKAGNTISTINPTTEEEICKVYAAEEDDVDIAVEAARKAFKHPSWSDIETLERGKLLYKLAELVERDAKILATIDALDNGKPYTVALGEDVAECINVFRHYGGWADKVYGRTIDTSPRKFAYVRQEPIGVCAQIIPWNYPLLMAAWKLGPALATGNVVVMKSAEQTPLSVLYLANLINEAGFPPGVVNILSGYGRTAGAALVQHLSVDKVAFTGSTFTGKQIMKMASVNLKNITLETGGKSPNIIFEDAELDQAVKWTHSGIMGNMGQVCTATSRVYVHENIYEKFLEEFKKHVAQVNVVGDPFEEATFQGPQVSKVQYDKILGYVESGLSEGARLISGGKKHGDKGYFIQPTIFADVKDHMTISREEIFGPFVCFSSFKTEDEVIARANDTVYGLGAAVFTRDLERAHKVAAKLEAGMVWINSSNDSHFGVPFGGVKQSAKAKDDDEKRKKRTPKDDTVVPSRDEDASAWGIRQFGCPEAASVSDYPASMGWFKRQVRAAQAPKQNSGG
ncbi:Omega-crystallin [Drechslerella dactyloides]|uniref:aldehyde dehydrogenase (NAD(+)) n=1 Tax=Drechslerella dactyloides TaxID=74499 RepID=A0AAD6ITR3_DREDA|nr:Omega-crystallin [Drechslerella dactyloides]